MHLSGSKLQQLKKIKHWITLFYPIQWGKNVFNHDKNVSFVNKVFIYESQYTNANRYYRKLISAVKLKPDSSEFRLPNLFCFVYLLILIQVQFSAGVAPISRWWFHNVSFSFFIFHLYIQFRIFTVITQ